MKSFKQGEIVEILPEYQDKGDADFTWVVIEDEEKGRVTIRPIDSPLTIKPTYVLPANYIKRKDNGDTPHQSPRYRHAR